MKKIMSPLAVAPLAALALVACGEQEPEVVGGMADPDAEELEEAAPVEALPPMRTREASFRCADNSVVYVSFYQNDTQVGVAMEQDAIQTILPNEALAAAEGEEEAAEAPAGPPRYSGEGYTLVGASDASTVQFARPGGGMQSCNS